MNFFRTLASMLPLAASIRVPRDATMSYVIPELVSSSDGYAETPFPSQRYCSIDAELPFPTSFHDNTDVSPRTESDHCDHNHCQAIFDACLIGVSSRLLFLSLFLNQGGLNTRSTTPRCPQI